MCATPATQTTRATRPAEVLIVGAGPTGLALALQAHDHGAHVRIVERRREVFRPSRALILHPRTLEVLRPLAVTEALLARADVAPEGHLHLGSRVVRARLGELALPDTAFPHLSLVRQMDVEMVLAQALADRGVEVERGTELIQVEDGAAITRATLRTAAKLELVECDIIAGCDGPDSLVRRSAGIRWYGAAYHQEVVLADVELDADRGRLTPGVAHVVAGRHGLLFVFPLGERATWRLLATRPADTAGSAGDDLMPFGQPGPPVPSTKLQALLDDVGLDARITALVWSARYRLQHRLAARFNRGRLYLVGDAAHAFSPATGQGMNMGIQDAMNLGWKLAFLPAAACPAALLDSYDRERRPAACQALAMTHLAFWFEASTAPLPALLRGVLAPLGAPAVPILMRQRWLVAEGIRWVSQLRLAYPDSPLSVEGTPQLYGSGRSGWYGWLRPGHRLPDATVVTADGQRVRLHALLAHSGVHVLLQRDAVVDVEHLTLGTQVTVHRLTSVPGTGLLAVRPDGYVGFSCGNADAGQLRAWLTHIGAGTSPNSSG